MVILILQSIETNKYAIKLRISFHLLRILTGKKYRQVKLQRLQKVGSLSFGSLVHQISSLCEALKLKQNFQKNKAVPRKTPLFVTGPFCTHFVKTHRLLIW